MPRFAAGPPPCLCAAPRHAEVSSSDRSAAGGGAAHAAGLATAAAARWPRGPSPLGGQWVASGVTIAVPVPLHHPWRAALAGRGFAKAVRVGVDVEQTRNKDPLQMLTMFRKKCRQNNIHSMVRAKRFHKKPNEVRVKREKR
jgi:hypothetical protein